MNIWIEHADGTVTIACARPSRRGGSSGSPMSDDACPAGKDPRHCDRHNRQPAMDPRYLRCQQCGWVGKAKVEAGA